MIACKNAAAFLDPRLPMRFWSKCIPEPNSGCWLWIGVIAKDRGYGMYSTDGRSLGAHRVSFRRLIGEVPEGLELDHLCRTRNCVNPGHLEPVTHLENVRRGCVGLNMSSKTHCPRGHEYSEENTRFDKQSRHGGLSRICRRCEAQRTIIRRTDPDDAPPRAITIRMAVGIALEGLSGDLADWARITQQRATMKAHVYRFVHDFARSHGVILTDDDIKHELEQVVADLKGGKPLGEAARG